MTPTTIIILSVVYVIVLIILIKDLIGGDVKYLKRKDLLFGFTWPVWIVIVPLWITWEIVKSVKYVKIIYNVLRYDDALHNVKSTKEIAQKENNTEKKYEEQ